MADGGRGSRVRMLLAPGLLLASGLILGAAPEHVCVPADGGGWACGDTRAPPAPAALPERNPLGTPSTTSSPPLLLIDPKRFRLDGPDRQAEAAAGLPPPEPVPEPPVAPAPEPEPVVARHEASPSAAPVVSTPGVDDNASFQALTPGQYTLQLAAAGSPDGFAALLKRLDAGLPHWRLRVQRGGQAVWLLVLGTFADAASARAAVPTGATGAFPKPVVQLQQEL